MPDNTEGFITYNPLTLWILLFEQVEYKMMGWLFYNDCIYNKNIHQRQDDLNQLSYSSHLKLVLYN